jgi:hypothetical protein
LSDHTKTSASDGSCVDRARIEVIALHQQIRQAGGASQRTDLPPESPSLKGEVEVGNRLPFHEGAEAEVIIAYREPASLNAKAKLKQSLEDTTSSFERIGDDRAH